MWVRPLAPPAVLALFASVSLGALLLAPQGLSGRQVPPAAQGMSLQEIRDAVRRSGLTEAQVRSRLRSAGYAPEIADQLFGEGAEGPGRSPFGDQDFIDVMNAIGVSLRQGDDRLRVGTDTVPQPAADSLDVTPIEELAPLEVFGRDVFTRRSTEFLSSLVGPVGPDYPLGPGDEVLLILTGDVELSYRLNVTREGSLVIPDVGQVPVAGTTLAELEDRLYDLLGRVYSGVRRGPDATTHFDVSLGQLRTVQVYVVGEVERPGAYRVSSVATVLEALYEAGGPRETGSFRRLSVRRGGRQVGTFDLYRYLTAGDTPASLRLQEGDVVFVPTLGSQVALRGEVVRPALYELAEGEGLPDLVRAAGGLLPSARTDVVRVDRIASREERVEGRDRLVLDVDLDAVDSGRTTFALRAGDEITVFPVLEDPRGWVSIDGAVYRPGRYQLTPDATVASLVELAGGALPDVLAPTVHVSSLDLTDGSRRLTRIPLGVASSVPLREFDEVSLFGRDSLLLADSVSVFGMVRNPGSYPLSRGATAEDVVLMAGGLTLGADPRQAEVARYATSVDGVRTSTSRIVTLSGSIPYPGPVPRDSLPPLGPGALDGAAAPLEPGDEVYVRQIPQFRRPRHVEVSGEVVAPGRYVLETVDERLSSVIARAGGVTERAFVDGFRLVRDGITVGVDLDRALREPNEETDPVLVDGDTLLVPVYDATVLVTGAVEFDTRVVYRRGMGLGDVLSAAGGVVPGADKGRISVEYANGSRETVSRFLGINFSTPSIRPGATVFVPISERTDDGFSFDEFLSRILAISSTVAALAVALR